MTSARRDSNHPTEGFLNAVCLLFICCRCVTGYLPAGETPYYRQAVVFGKIFASEGLRPRNFTCPVLTTKTNQMSEILIIDDEKAIRKTLSEILSYEGYKIEEASDGEEGLKKFKEKNFDVVLCDIKMPKIDGLEFLERAREAHPDIPVIMISGHGNIDTAVEAVKKGAFDYISKPPDLNRLLITIKIGRAHV